MLPGFVEYTKNKVGYVYLLYHFDKLVYIGSTVNLSSRINEHSRNTRLVFNRAYYKSCPTLEQARELEAELILEFQPSENVLGKLPINVKISGTINLQALGINVSLYGGLVRRI